MAGGLNLYASGFLLLVSALFLSVLLLPVLLLSALVHSVLLAWLHLTLRPAAPTCFAVVLYNVPIHDDLLYMTLHNAVHNVA